MGDKLYTAGNCLVYLGAIIQPENLFKWIQLGLGILLTVVGIVYKVWKWHKEAKADGEITTDEVKELVSETKDDVIKVITDTKELVKDIDKNAKK